MGSNTEQGAIILQWYFEYHRLAAQHDLLRLTLANKESGLYNAKRPGTESPP